MRSSKDIKPVVGMQLLFMGEPCSPVSEYDEKGFLNAFGWNLGHYEIIWTPPTDEERQMFRDAAEHNRKLSKGAFEWPCPPVCHWFAFDENTFEQRREICESLAMDGM